MEHAVLEPIGVEAGPGSRWMVVIRNNDTNTFDEVIAILMSATGCTTDEASIEAWEAHTFGRASVHFSSKVDCLAAAKVIQEIGIATDVVPEWE